MKLIVTIPALNEEATIATVIKEIPRQLPGIDEVRVLVLDDGSRDRTVEVAKAAGADIVISHRVNQGLARTFQDAIDAALEAGADIIVNTDADNHYDQSRIGELVAPILAGQAEGTVANRMVLDLEEMPAKNKYLNAFGSWMMTRLTGLPKLDVSSGYRAYSREAAMRLRVYSNHTYVHTTLMSLADQRLKVIDVPIKARPVARQSRLIKSIPKHMMSAGTAILRNIILFKPLRFFSLVGGIVTLVGTIFVIRFLVYYFSGSGTGHIQSLILAGVLIIVGFQIGILGFIASAIGWNRRTLEDILYHVKRQRFTK